MFILNKKWLIVLIVAAISLAIVVIYYYQILAPSPSREEILPQILGHISHIESSDDVRFLVIEGIVQNNLYTNVKINVTAIFHDTENNKLGEKYATTDLKILKPEQKSSFTIYWLLDSSEVKYELGLVYTVTSEKNVDFFEFADLTNQTENGEFVIKGEIWNKRVLNAEGVVVKCAYWNAEGNFSGLYGTYIPLIDAGGNSPFEFRIDLSMDPAKYDLIVFAVRYEDRSIVNYVLFAFLVLIFAGLVIFMKRRGW